MPSLGSGIRDRALSGIERLPKLSAASTRLLAAFGRRDVEVKDLVVIVRRDPMLAARVLQLANSATFGRLRRFQSLPHAVAFLGPATLRRYALSWTVAGLFKRLFPPPLWSTTRFTMHSEATALLADIICDQLPVKGGDAAFTAGLLHDIGKFIICVEAPNAIELVLSLRAKSSDPVTECERQILGTDHAELSSIAVQKWHLSDAVCAAVHYHHEPERDESCAPIPLSLVLAKADMFVNGLGLNFLSCPKDASSVLEWPGHEDAMSRAVTSFGAVLRVSNDASAAPDSG